MRRVVSTEPVRVEIVTIRMTTAEREQLRIAAKNKRLSMAGYIRAAAEKFAETPLQAA